MAFWGVEIKPGKPYTLLPDNTRGRLRISQATLGLGSSNYKSIFVQCNVGKKTPVFLCCLLPDKAESVHLEVEFQEVEEVTFSVIGPRSVHLTGHIVRKSRQLLAGDDESESFGEDLGDADTELSEEFNESDEYGGSFIDDDEPAYRSSSPSSSEDAHKRKKKSGMGKGSRKRLKKVYQLSDSEDDGLASCKNAALNHNSKQIVEINQDDQKPISSLCGNAKIDSEAPERKADDVAKQATGDCKSDDRKVKRLKGDDFAVKTTDDRKVKGKKGGDVAAKTTDGCQHEEKKPKKKKQTKKKDEKPENLEKPALVENGAEKTNLGSRATSDGLVIEELDFGELDGRIATSGKKVTLHYTGRLREGNQVFDSTAGRTPLKFRLGKEEGAIDGLTLGIEGMRVGGKRRFIIPPELGYGSEGTERVPPNSWLVMEVELLRVR